MPAEETGPFRDLTPDRQVALCTVVCFPYAGGGARVFRGWPRHLSRLVRVLALQLPGREERGGDAPEVDPERLVGDLVTALAPVAAAGRTVLFGHSLGAALAARVAQELFGGGAGRTGGDEALLVVSGRRAPWSDPAPSGTDAATDDELLARLGARGGGHARLAADAGMADVLLPALRADLRLSSTLTGIRERGVDLPVIGLYGSRDEAATLGRVRQWARFTTGRFESVEIEGDHFFLDTNTERVAGLVDAAARSLIGL